MTSGGIDWQREKWQSGLGSKFIHQGEKNAVKYADEVIVLSKGVQDYFKEGEDWHEPFETLSLIVRAGCGGGLHFASNLAGCAEPLSERNRAIRGDRKNGTD